MGICSHMPRPIQITDFFLLTGAVTSPPPCLDRIPNCVEYTDYACQQPEYRMWVLDNCKKFCNLCESLEESSQTPMSSIASSVTTGLSDMCQDTVPFCSVYSKSACLDHSWGKSFCARFCGLCEDGSEEVCQDSLPFCDTYSVTACQNGTWARLYCARFCAVCD